MGPSLRSELPSELLYWQERIRHNGVQALHEMSVATSLMRVLSKKLVELAPCKLTALELTVGELSGIDRESLRFALDTLVTEAGYDGVELRFEPGPAVFACIACNWQGQLDSFTLVCPDCNGAALDIIAGQDVSLERIEIE